MAFIPTANYQLTAVQEACLVYFRRGVSFVPYYELKNIKSRIENFVPFPKQII